MAVKINVEKRDSKIVGGMAEAEVRGDRFLVSSLDLELRNRSRGGNRVDFQPTQRRGNGFRGTIAREWGEILD